MIYQLYQAHADMLAGMRLYADCARYGIRLLESLHPTGRPGLHALRQFGAALDLFRSSAITHARPPYGFERVQVGNRELAVREEAALTTPFGTLLHFRKESAPPQPRVLVVAPLSGHFATLLRGTVKVLLPENDVYITDWHNGRDVPLRAGPFGYDEYVLHLVQFLEHLGPGTHVIGVCQPAPAVIAATALMAEDNSPATPRSMVLMAGPVDTRLNPTAVNKLAKSKSMAWFERNLIGRVPLGCKGQGRRVYPGFLQLSAFMAMNSDRHLAAFGNQYRHLLDGNFAASTAHREFYDEYFAMLDMPAEFYLETVRRVFQDHELPRGRMTIAGRPVRPEAITRTALLAVEGEKDDICSIGQTMAALDLCSGIPASMKRYHLQTGVGHYGVFSGRRWATEIYPVVREVMQGKRDMAPSRRVFQSSGLNPFASRSPNRLPHSGRLISSFNAGGSAVD